MSTLCLHEGSESVARVAKGVVRRVSKGELLEEFFLLLDLARQSRPCEVDCQELPILELCVRMVVLGWRIPGLHAEILTHM